MPRPFCKRTIGLDPDAKIFMPIGIPGRFLEEIILSLDEAEAIRLADLEGLYQEAAARSMNVSRQTFGRIIESARKKVADAIINKKMLKIAGGSVQLKEEGEEIMNIAVPSRGDQIDNHFGHCEKYTIFEVEGNMIKAQSSLDAVEGCGCKSNIASTLASMGVRLMIAGGIGEGAIRVLASNGIKTIRGASGSVQKAVEDYLAGQLTDSGETCHSHSSGHVCSHTH